MSNPENQTPTQPIMTLQEWGQRSVETERERKLREATLWASCWSMVSPTSPVVEGTPPASWWELNGGTSSIAWWETNGGTPSNEASEHAEYAAIEDPSPEGVEEVEGIEGDEEDGEEVPRVLIDQHRTARRVQDALNSGGYGIAVWYGEHTEEFWVMDSEGLHPFKSVIEMYRGMGWRD